MRSSCNLLLFSRAFCRFFSISARLRTGPDEDEEEEEEEEEEEDDDDDDDDDDANEEEAEEGLTMGALLALMQVEQRQLCVWRKRGPARRRGLRIGSSMATLFLKPSRVARPGCVG